MIRAEVVLLEVEVTNPQVVRNLPVTLLCPVLSLWCGSAREIYVGYNNLRMRRRTEGEGEGEGEGYHLFIGLYS